MKLYIILGCCWGYRMSCCDDMKMHRDYSTSLSRKREWVEKLIQIRGVKCCLLHTAFASSIFRTLICTALKPISRYHERFILYMAGDSNSQLDEQ